MAFKNGCYATVKDINTSHGFTKYKLSIRRKGQDGQYVCEFTEYCLFYSDARKKSEADPICTGDRLCLKSVDVSTKFVKGSNGENKKYYSFIVYDYEVVKRGEGVAPAPLIDGTSLYDDDDLPF